jgi:hypothetical protein
MMSDVSIRQRMCGGYRPTAPAGRVSGGGSLALGYWCLILIRLRHKSPKSSVPLRSMQAVGDFLLIFLITRGFAPGYYHIVPDGTNLKFSINQCHSPGGTKR